MYEQRNFQREKKPARLKKAAVLFCAVIPLLCLAIMLGVWTVEALMDVYISGTFQAVWIVVAGVSFIIGVILLIVYICKNSKGLGTPILALILEFAGPLIFGVLTLLDLIFALLFILPAIILPIAGAITGVQALFECKKEKNPTGVFLSLIAILLPVFATVFIVLMFSTGVWVIRFM